MLGPLPKRMVVSALLGAGLAVVSSGTPTYIPVEEFALRPPREAPPQEYQDGVWYDWVTANGGSASIVSLEGEVGPLKDNQPLPRGAALLTTTDGASSYSNVGVYNPFAWMTVGEVFPYLSINYSFLKASNPGQNLNAAAALKLEIYNPCCGTSSIPNYCIDSSTDDCYGTLVYEPHQQDEFENEPPQDEWHEAFITDGSGTFWWTGGFGETDPNIHRSLSEWLTYMPNKDDFAAALIVTVQIGVGSGNAGQIAYFDQVGIQYEPTSSGAFHNVYNFELPLPVSISLRPKSSNSKQVNPWSHKMLVPIAVLGYSGFDPLDQGNGIDVKSVEVRGARATAKIKAQDVNQDGYDDLLLYFRASKFSPKPTPVECKDENAEIKLTGQTLDGTPIEGYDDVKWIGRHCNGLFN